MVDEDIQEFSEGELYFEGVSATVVNGELRLEDEDGFVIVFKDDNTKIRSSFKKGLVYKLH